MRKNSVKNKIMLNGEVWLTTKGIMELIGLRSPTAVGKLYRKGLEATKFGRSYAVREKDLAEFMLRRKKAIGRNLNPCMGS